MAPQELDVITRPINYKPASLGNFGAVLRRCTRLLWNTGTSCGAEFKYFTWSAQAIAINFRAMIRIDYKCILMCNVKIVCLTQITTD